MPQKKQLTQQPLRITFTPLTILKFVGVLLLLIFVYVIRDILLLIFVSMVLAAAFDPWVDAMKKKGLPRPLGILLIYVILISVFVFAFVMMIPPIIEQLTQLYASFPSLLQNFSSVLESFQGFSIKESLQQGIGGSLNGLQPSQAVTSVFSVIGNFVGGVFGIFLTLVITFYMVVKEDNIGKLVKTFSPKKYEKFFMQILRDISKKMGLWLRGQLLLGVIVGVMVYIPLKILGVQYALVLAVLAGVTELIPFVGPWIGAVPGILIAFLQSPILGLAATVIYIVVQQLENNVITPKLMSKVVGLSPLVVIVALLIGIKVAGMLGALMAVPAALIVSTLLKYIDKMPE